MHSYRGLISFSSARVVVECAFGRLKARFIFLKSQVDLDLQNAITAIHSCFILQNFWEMNNEVIDKQEANTN